MLLWLDAMAAHRLQRRAAVLPGAFELTTERSGANSSLCVVPGGKIQLNSKEPLFLIITPRRGSLFFCCALKNKLAVGALILRSK